MGRIRPFIGYHILGRLWYTVVMKERWMDVKNYEGIYQISNLGRLRRLPVIGRRRNSKSISYPNGSLNPKGYLKHKLYSLDGTSRTFSAHVLVASAFIPNHDDKPQVNHMDGNKLNNQTSNLEWCTNAENAAHANTTGLVDNKGEKSGKAKYDESTIRKVIETKGELTNRYWAENMGTPISYIKSIRNGRRWRHIWSEYNG